MDKNGKKEDAGGIIPKAPNKFNKIFLINFLIFINQNFIFRFQNYIIFL